MIICKRCLFIIICFLSLSVLGQNNSIWNSNPQIDTSEVGKLFLNIDNLNFFKDNEFSAEKVSGYTLPGFCLSTSLSMAIYDNLLLEAGVYALNYWGTNKYPMYSYLDISPWKAEKYQYFFHFLPIFKAQVSLKNYLHLIFGTLYQNNNHNLITPLFNPEFNLSSDPETGVQLLFNSKHFEADLWLNWQSFIFRYDTHQEVFSIGLSTKTKILKPQNKFELYIPLQIIAQHRGGEMDTIFKDNLQTWTNYALGFGIRYNKINRFINYIGFEFYYAGFIQNVGTMLPFKKGYGFYPKLNLGIKDFDFTLSYWDSEDFVSILGSPHFWNISTNTEGLVFDRMKMIHSKLEYNYKSFDRFVLGLMGEAYYYFPFTGDRPGYIKVIRGDAISFSFGIFLKINPKFRLLN